MFTTRPWLRAALTTALALVGGTLAAFPLLLAGETPVSADATPVIDQRSEVHIASDVAADARTAAFEQSTPFFNALCGSGSGLWAQTMAAGRAGQLTSVELLLLRRSSDIAAPIAVEIRAVDGTGRPTEAVLGRGVTTDAIPAHRATPSWTRVPLDAPIQLKAGQKVAIFPTSSTAPSGACYEWVSGGLDRYASGTLAVTFDGGITFIVEGGSDAGFRAWLR